MRTQYLIPTESRGHAPVELFLRNLLKHTRLQYILMLAILAVSLVLPLLTLVGVQFGSEVPGGPGLHFAHGVLGQHLVRLDIATLGITLFIAALAIGYLAVANSRFVLLLGATIVLSGLVTGIQILPPNPAGTSAADTVWVTAISRFTVALFFLVGGAMFRFSHVRGRISGLFRMLAPGVPLLLTAWLAMAHGPRPAADEIYRLNLATLAFYACTGLMFKSKASYARLRLFGQGALGGLIPLGLGQIGLTFLVETPMDSAYQIAVLLQWFAFMLPGGGLIVDTLNAVHARGLVRERRYLRSVIDSIPHYIFARDTEGRFTLVNRAVADFYGMKVHQVEGRYLAEIHEDQDQAEQWLAEDRQTFELGQDWVVPTTTARAADGEKIWIRALKKPLPIEPGRPPEVLGVSIDISDEKRAQKALAEQMAMEKAASEIHEAFALCTPENFAHNMNTILGVLARFLQSNRAFVYRFDEEGHLAHLVHSWTAVEPSVASGCPPVIRREDMRWLVRRFETDVPVCPGTLGGLPDEAEPFREVWDRPAETGFLAVPIFHQGNLFGFVGLDSDQRRRWEHKELGVIRMVIDMFITIWSKHEVERSLVLAIEAAEASNRAKTEFLANMSHEIRTPLNAVLGITDLLLELDPTTMQHQYLGMIQTSGDALLTLINDLLDLAKIESGKLELDPHEVDLQELVDEVVNLSAINAQARGLELIARLGDGVPQRAMVDGTRLRQVLLNLMSNAIKFTKEGHVRLDIETEAGDEGKPRLRLSVRDTGIGIDPAGLRRIFEKFTQADASTTRKFGGTGLGLNICRQLVDLMGGRISAESEPGAGSTFHFTLPLVPAEGTPTKTPKASGQVLLISGFEESGQVLAERIQRLGARCTRVTDRIEAERQLARMEHDPHANWSTILVDSELEPQLRSALDRALITAPTRPALVLMSNMSEARRELDLESRGIRDVLPRPVLQPQLVRVLQTDQEAGLAATALDAAQRTESSAPSNPSFPRGPEDLSTQAHILLVEDNVFNQKVGIGILELLGCRVSVADNGREAVELCAETDFDLIFMDCQMPEMDGFEATRQIRSAQGEGRHVPIIAMTANTMQSDKDACFAAGMDDFLSKPVGRAVLAAVLEKWQMIPAGSSA